MNKTGKKLTITKKIKREKLKNRNILRKKRKAKVCDVCGYKILHPLNKCIICVLNFLKIKEDSK